MPTDQMQYFALQRSLSILRHLQRESTDRISLMLRVQLDLGLDAYEDVQSKAGQRAFEGDVRPLKELGVEIVYDRAGNVYRLVSYGDFSPVGLSEQRLNTLDFACETYGGDRPIRYTREE